MPRSVEISVTPSGRIAESPSTRWSLSSMIAWLLASRKKPLAVALTPSLTTVGWPPTSVVVAGSPVAGRRVVRRRVDRGSRSAEPADVARAEAAGATPRAEIVGEAASVEDGVAMIRRCRPDVVLLDVHLPGGGGQHVITVVRAGARRYVTKAISATELLDAVERVHGGDAVFSPRLAGFVLDAFSGDLPAPADPELDQLTPREQEVLRLIARGYPYKQVASRLHLSVKTIETHVSTVLRKLQLSSRHQLTAWANERRLI